MTPLHVKLKVDVVNSEPIRGISAKYETGIDEDSPSHIMQINLDGLTESQQRSALKLLCEEKNSFSRNDDNIGIVARGGSRHSQHSLWRMLDFIAGNSSLQTSDFTICQTSLFLQCLPHPPPSFDASETVYKSLSDAFHQSSFLRSVDSKNSSIDSINNCLVSSSKHCEATS